MYTLRKDGVVVATQTNPIEYFPEQWVWKIDDMLICDTDKVMMLERSPDVPASVTMRQACLALENAGILDDVEALVATLPRPYQIEWQRASMVERTNALVEVVRQQKAMTVAEIDDLFILAESL